MLCFARLIRCAMVASGTRNALAISAVVKPPTARRVRAIAEDKVRAGWQHMNSKINVSSGSMSDSISSTGATVSTSFANRDFPLTTGSFAAHLVGQASGCDLNQPAAWILRNTLLRPLREGRYHSLLNGILSGGEVAKTASDRAEHLRCKFAQQMLGSRVPRLCHCSSRYSISGGGPLITGRTSIGMFRGAPPGPGAADSFAAIA